MDFARGLIDRTKDLVGCKNQIELAEHFGVSRKQVSEWRNGNASPPYFKLIKIAKENNVNLNWFFFGVGEKYLSSSDMKQINNDDGYKKYLVVNEGLSEQEKEIIMTIIDYMPYTPRAFFDKIIERFEAYKKQFKEMSSLE